MGTQSSRLPGGHARKVLPGVAAAFAMLLLTGCGATAQTAAPSTTPEVLPSASEEAAQEAAELPADTGLAGSHASCNLDLTPEKVDFETAPLLVESGYWPGEPQFVTAEQKFDFEPQHFSFMDRYMEEDTSVTLAVYPRGENTPYLSVEGLTTVADLDGNTALALDDTRGWGFAGQIVEADGTPDLIVYVSEVGDLQLLLTFRPAIFTSQEEVRPAEAADFAAAITDVIC